MTSSTVIATGQVCVPGTLFSKHLYTCIFQMDMFPHKLIWTRVIKARIPDEQQ